LVNLMPQKLKPNKGFSLIEISITVLIIAVLIAGISTGIDLYKDSKIALANDITKKSPLTRMPELALWLETSKIENLECYGTTKTCDNNGKIKIWFDINPTTIDKINVGRNSNGNSTPTYVEDGINGLPAINFDQDNLQYLSNNEVTNPSPPPIIKNKPDYTMIVVWKPIKKSVYNNTVSSTIWPQHLISQGSTYSLTCNSNCNLSGSIIFNPSNNLGFWGYYNSWGANIVKRESVANASIMIIEASDASNSKVTLYNNSLTASSGTFSKTLIGTCEFTLGVFACRKASATNFHGLISEAIVFNRAITNFEAKNIMQYLSQKWSIRLE
jgi:prepilin-type N-terminal cleavage/methylation domain-containing protein